MIYRTSLLSTLMLVIGVSAFANEEPRPMPAEYCFPAEGIIDRLGKFDSLKPEKRDTVAPDISVSIDLDEGEAMPASFELRDGDTVTPIQFDEMNKSIGLVDQLRQQSETAQFCVVDPAREGRDGRERGYQVDVGVGIRFKTTPGVHTLDEIEDGLKDGRSHYKKMAGAMGFMVPKFDHLAIAGDDDNNPPQIWATADGVDLGQPDYELYDSARMVRFKDLEEMGADGIRIEGEYRMTPSPDAKTVAKFSGRGDED